MNFPNPMIPTKLIEKGRRNPHIAWENDEEAGDTWHK